MPPAPTDPAPPELLVEHINGVALVTLNRPQALNAVTRAMAQQLQGVLAASADDPATQALVLRGAGPRAFCAGGDVLALWHSLRDSTPLHREFFVDKYRLDHRIHFHPKPVVAWVHGAVMGGGMGLMQGAALRLVGPGTRMAMPEVRIGLVPDVGASHFFKRTPAPLALYLALTGVTINAADALYCGLADAASAVQEAADLPARLATIRWPKAGGAAPGGRFTATLAALRAALATSDGPGAPHHTPHLAPATLPAHAAAIARHFRPGHPVPAIAAALQATAADPADAHAAWAAATLALLRQRSPLMLALTEASLRRGRTRTLADCLRMEYDLVQQALASGEFSEGVRAYLVDRDEAPRWQPPTLEALGEARVAACLAAQSHPHPLADLQDPEPDGPGHRAPPHAGPLTPQEPT